MCLHGRWARDLGFFYIEHFILNIVVMLTFHCVHYTLAWLCLQYIFFSHTTLQVICKGKTIENRIHKCEKYACDEL